MEASEAAAIEQARAGEPDGFRVLVELHSRSVFRLAYRMTGHEQDAEDVVQETFLRVWRRVRRFDARSKFGTWLHSITVKERRHTTPIRFSLFSRAHPGGSRRGTGILPEASRARLPAPRQGPGRTPVGKGHRGL